MLNLKLPCSLQDLQSTRLLVASTFLLQHSFESPDGLDYLLRSPSSRVAMKTLDVESWNMARQRTSLQSKKDTTLPQEV